MKVRLYHRFVVLISSCFVLTALSAAPLLHAASPLTNANLFSPIEYDRPHTIDLVYFKGKMFRDRVMLTWMSSASTEPNGFSIEMKVDNQPWEKIGWVDASSESHDTPEYRFIFEDFMTGQYYFRLVQKDLFGVESYSGVVSMHFTGQPNSLLAYSNPDHTMLLFDGPPADRIERISLFDFAGNVIYESEDMEGGYMISVSHIPSGLYILECVCGNIRARTNVIL